MRHIVEATTENRIEKSADVLAPPTLLVTRRLHLYGICIWRWTMVQTAPGFVATTAGYLDTRIPAGLKRQLPSRASAAKAAAR